MQNGTFQNYNADQKSAIKSLPEGVDGNDYYLFFVDCYDGLDTSVRRRQEPTLNGGLLLDGLGIINTYMTKSTQFTQEEIYQIETLRKHLKTWNDDVVY